MDLIKAAEEFMLNYMSDGKERQPSDFDEDILGIGADIMILTGVRPRWNSTIFFDALGNLVEAGKITFRQDSEGAYYYKIGGGEDS